MFWRAVVIATVTLATREAIRFASQRILGADFLTWLKWTGLEQTKWLNDQSTPVLDEGRVAQLCGAWGLMPDTYFRIC